MLRGPSGPLANDPSITSKLDAHPKRGHNFRGLIIDSRWTCSVFTIIVPRWLFTKLSFMNLSDVLCFKNLGHLTL